MVHEEYLRIVAAYDLAQNPVGAILLSIESAVGWSADDLVVLEAMCLRLDALYFDSGSRRFENLVLHFVDEAERTAFLDAADLSHAREIRPL